jgi:replicative DNA helicase
MEEALVKRLLRGIVDFEDEKVSLENLSVNFQRLMASKVEWVRPADEKIFTFVQAYFQAQLELPSALTIKDYFNRSNDIEVEERLKDVQAASVFVRTNYAHLLKQLLEDQNRIKMRVLLKEAEEIVSKGLIIQEGREKNRLQGVKDALLHFNRKAHDLIPPEHNALTRGDVREDAEALWQEYQEAKFNKGKVWGKFSGLNEIDKVCHGIKKGELWIHAAFAGELKTTMSSNWGYNLITRYRSNVFYVNLEMPYKQMRRIVTVMHSANPRFEVQGKGPLDYRKVRDGELTDEEEAFYQEVLKDWKENPEYCHFETWCPDRDVTIADIRLEAELLHKQMDVGLIIIDHGGLVEPKKRHHNYTIELNSVIRDAKKLALHFNGGEGVPVLMLFQINREGKDQAEKSDGKYKMKALAYANESERSADYISTTYLDDTHRENGTTMCCNLKNRDNPLFKPFLIKIDFASRRMHNLDPASLEGHDMSVEEHDSVLNTMMAI